MSDIVQTTYDQLVGALGAYVPNVLGAVVILIIGWFVAKIVAAVVKGVLKRTGLDTKVNTTTPLSQSIGTGAYYIIMILVLVAFFQALGLTMVTEPLNTLLNQVFAYLPKLIGAGVLLLVAWIVATLLRMVVRKGLDATGVDQKLGDGEADSVPLSQSLSEALYWLIFLFFLPAILTALSLQGLLDPVQGMLDEILGFLPNLLTAVILLLIGWFVARLVQRIVSSLLAAAGADKLAERVGLAGVLGQMQLSGLAGNICYAFILIPIVISALNALQLDSITAPASAMLGQILGAIPAIFAAAVVLGISYFIGKLVSGLVANLLAGIGFDRIFVLLGWGEETKIGDKSPSQVLGAVVMVFIMLFAAVEALSLLGFGEIGALVTTFIAFAGHILFGLVILAIGIYIANAVAKVVGSTKVASAGLLATIARVAILFFAGSMALGHMGLADEIITSAFTVLLGALGIAAAIAFGLGGRESAAALLEEWRNNKAD